MDERQLELLMDEHADYLMKVAYVYTKMVSSKDFLVQDPYNDFESILKIDVKNVTREIVDHHISLYPYVFIGNSIITLKKTAYIEYKMTNQDRSLVLIFTIENDEWKFSGFKYD